MRRFFEYLRETLWRARVKTCCFVAPLRAGLLCLTSINIIIALVQLVGTANGAAIFMPILAHVQADIFDDDPSPTACILPSAVDLAFNAVLLAALSRRDAMLLGVFCCYVLVSIFLSFLVYGLLEAVINPLYLFVIILNGVYQIFILILVRSMMVEIELRNASDKNQFIYNKDQGMVIIRDVESPPPGAIGIASYPALPEPEITTSITTLATLNEQRLDTPADSRLNTLNKNNTLKTSTLKAYKTTQDGVTNNTQKSATLPYKDTTFVHKQINTPRIGAIQSLAGPSTYIPMGSNIDTTNKETLATPAKNTSDATNVGKLTDNNKTDDKIKDNSTSVQTVAEINDAPQKKKRGIFSRVPKDQNNKKETDATPSSTTDTDSTVKPSSSNTILKEQTVKITTDSTTSAITTDNAKDDTVIKNQQGKKEDTSQKKKRGIFAKTPKESKSKKEKKGKGKKDNGS